MAELEVTLDQAALEHTDNPSHVVGLEACAATATRLNLVI